MKNILFFCAFMLIGVIGYVGCAKSTDDDAVASNAPLDQGLSLDGSEKAAKWCSCLPYIRNCTGLGSHPSCRSVNGVLNASCGAAAYGSVLITAGYTAYNTPQSGDIVVFGTGFGGGINATYGHIGYVRTVKLVGTGTSAYYSVGIKSANWTGNNTYTSCSCNNVEDATINVNTATRKANIKYYRK